MKRQIFLRNFLLLALGLSMPAFAQDDDEIVYADDAKPAAAQAKPVVKKAPQYPMKQIKGVVVSAATNQPLAGIQLQSLNNNHYAAMTNAKGEFTISVPTFESALYVFSPQYMSQQVAIADNSELRVVMLPEKFRQMYANGTDVTASSGAQVVNTTSQTIDTDIEGLLGGDVHAITRSGGPGYGAAMFIRGINSLNSNAQPLFVIDGVIRDMQPTRGTLHYGDYSNLLLNLNPEDIAEVKVLKNATALYGAKGANGVIIINTKRGHSMATRIDANIGVGVTMVPQLPDMMNSSQFRTYATEMMGSHPNVNDYEYNINFLNDDPTNYYYHTYHNNTDWTKEVYQTALNQNYNINVQGGDDVGMYNLSVGYTDGQSTAKKNGFNRLNVRFNTDIQVINKLTTRFDMAFTKVNRNVFDNGAPEDFTTSPVASPTLLGLIKSPFLNPYAYSRFQNKFSTTYSGPDEFVTWLDSDLTLGNPTALLANGDAVNKNRVETTEFYAVIAPKYQFNSHLSLSETFNYTLERISQRYYRPTTGMPRFLIDGIGMVQNLAMSQFSKETSIVSDTRLNYENHFGAHYLNVYGGLRFVSFAYDSNAPQGQFKTAANDKQPNVNTNMDYKSATGVMDENRSFSWYANADYNYANRYFATVALSLETSSRFGKHADGLGMGGVKWAVFPSVQLGWNITNEKWFPKNDILNYFLLRAGFDMSGNDDIDSHAARTSFGVMKYLGTTTAAQLNNIGNDEIQWEQTNKWNVGFKTYLLNNRVGLDFNYYIHTTDNLLTLKSFSNPTAGINNYWSNGGKLQNKGFEFTFSGKPVVSKDWNVELGASIGHYKNTIKSLPNDDKIFVGGVQNATGFTSSAYGVDNIATIVGQAAGSFYGYKTLGVFASDAEAKAANNGDYLYMKDAADNKIAFKAGDVHFADLNGDGIIGAEDRTVIGNPNPDIYGNIFGKVAWKNLTLTLGFNYSLGNDVFNYQRSVLESGSNFYNQTVAMTNRWRYEGQKTNMPRAVFGDPMGNSRFSDRWIEDGSYLRLKTLNLTYKVPVNLSWLQGLAVWAEANNVFTITKYLGSDPEFSVANNVLYQGIDAGNIAQSRTFTFGVRINL